MTTGNKISGYFPPFVIWVSVEENGFISKANTTYTAYSPIQL